MSDYIYVCTALIIVSILVCYFLNRAKKKNDKDSEATNSNNAQIQDVNESKKYFGSENFEDELKKQIELNKYIELKSNNFDLSTAECNFQCSLTVIALKQIKENKNFKNTDFGFDIDERINEFTQKGCDYFQNSKMNSFVALDIETTGLSRENDRIIQIAMVKVENGNVVDTYNKYVNPQKHISAAASEVNGIYDSDVADEKIIKQLFPEIWDFIGKLPIVAHNASFDMGFLRNEWNRCFDEDFPKHKDICTMKLWRLLFKYFQEVDPPSSKLVTLVTNLLEKDDIKKYHENAHNALCDALLTAKVFMKMYDDNYLKLINNK